MNRGRREALGAAGSWLAVGLAGCLNGAFTSNAEDATTTTPSQSTDDETEQKTRDDSTHTTENRTTDSPRGHPYIAEMTPNPEGDDTENLNDEEVVISTSEAVDHELTGYRLEYSTDHTYAFPAVVEEAEPPFSITVYSGTGNDEARDHEADDEYDVVKLYAGASEPLLANDGGTVALLDREGEVVDKLSYDAVEEGQIVAVPD